MYQCHYDDEQAEDAKAEKSTVRTRLPGQSRLSSPEEPNATRLQYRRCSTRDVGLQVGVARIRLSHRNVMSHDQSSVEACIGSLSRVVSR